MLSQKILLFMAFSTVSSYYFYNPNTHQILTKSSIENIPRGYKLLPPPRSSRKRTRSQRGNASGHCADAGFTCSSPFDKSQTFQYECDYDSNCPKNYKCCQQKCFVHKICSKAVFSQAPSTGKNIQRSKTQRQDGVCEKWPYSCQKPYDYSFTSVFKCNYDRQCPRNFKCCQQSCFLHRICSRVVADIDFTNTSKVDDKFTTSIKLTTEVTTDREIEYLSEKQTDIAVEKVKTTTENSLVSEYVYEDENGNEDKDDDDGTNTSKVDDKFTEVTTDREIENFTEKQTDIPVEKVETTTENSLVNEYVYEDEDEDEDYDYSETGEGDKNQTTEENKNSTMNISTSAIADVLTPYEEETINIHDNTKTSNLTTGLDIEITEVSSDGTPTVIDLLTYKEAKNLNGHNLTYKSYNDKQTTMGLLFTTAKYVNESKKSTAIKKPDPNAIIPEYAAYYYYYDD